MEEGVDTPLTMEQQLEALSRLNLTKVKAKLMGPLPEGRDWTQEYADTAERWYRRYLTLIIKYPKQNHAPNQMVDEFWHQHIVDTRSYIADCQNIFGRYIHHNPYFGATGDRAECIATFNRTNELYRREFGEDPTEFGATAINCSTDCGWVDDNSQTLVNEKEMCT